LRAQRMFACVSNIESLVCIFICRLVSRAQHVSACVPARIKFQACLSMVLQRAEWVSSCVGLHQELSVSATRVCAYWELHKYLHVLVCIEGWAWFSKFGPVSRGEKLSACVGAHLGLAMIQHVLNCIGSWACVCTRHHILRAGYATSCVLMCRKAGSCYMEWSV
jgi:hypothetical protein